MPFYQVTYTAKDGKEWDDYLLERPSIKDAQWYAEHRISGAYGETDFVKAKLKRIDLHTTKEMVDANAVTWANDPRLFTG